MIWQSPLNIENTRIWRYTPYKCNNRRNDANTGKPLYLLVNTEITVSYRNLCICYQMQNGVDEPNGS